MYQRQRKYGIIDYKFLNALTLVYQMLYVLHVLQNFKNP